MANDEKEVLEQKLAQYREKGVTKVKLGLHLLDIGICPHHQVQYTSPLRDF